MVMKPENGKYLNLEDVRVFYDIKDDSIHLTSKDKDLPKGKGFHLTLNTGRKAELVLREMLEEAGIIPSAAKEPELPTFISLDEARNTAHPLKMPVGVSTGNEELIWNLETDPHCLVFGGTGSGKSVVLRNFLFHCFKHPNDFEVMAVDMGTVSFAPYLDMSPVLTKVVSTLEQVEKLLLDLQEEMMNRYQRMESAGVIHISQLDTAPKNLLLMIDEAAYLTYSTGMSDHGREQAADASRMEIRRGLGAISKFGRAAGIHLCISTQRPDSYVEDKHLGTDQIAYIGMGPISEELLATVFGQSKRFKTLHSRGRGFYKGAGAGRDFQAYFADMDWWNRSKS